MVVSDHVGNPEDRFSHNEAHFSCVTKTSIFGVSEQVRHKPSYTAAEDDERLEISDLGKRGIVLSDYVAKNKGADQLHGLRAADLCLCFSYMQKASFLIRRLI